MICGEHVDKQSFMFNSGVFYFSVLRTPELLTRNMGCFINIWECHKTKNPTKSIICEVFRGFVNRLSDPVGTMLFS